MTSKTIVAGRIANLHSYNGMDDVDEKRKNFEVYYMHEAYKGYLTDVLKVKDDRARKEAESLDDEKLVEYMAVRHPRFAALAKEHGFQPSDVSSQRFGG